MALVVFFVFFNFVCIRQLNLKYFSAFKCFLLTLRAPNVYIVLMLLCRLIKRHETWPGHVFLLLCIKFTCLLYCNMYRIGHLHFTPILYHQAKVGPIESHYKHICLIYCNHDIL